MKHILRNLLPSIFFLFGLIFCLSGCYESRYNRTNHHHTRGWYEHRHRQPPAGVNFEIDINTRHRRH
jgi:hypothetical protein